MTSERENRDAWAVVEAMSLYYHDSEESPHHSIVMNDVWGWATGDRIVVTDKNVQRIAQLYERYGFCGLLYYCVEADGYVSSEFTDNNRFIQFVQNEERIRTEVADHNRRGYAKRRYVIDGEIEPVG